MILKNNYNFGYPTLLKNPEHFKKSTLNLRCLFQIKDDEINLTYILNINSEYINELLEQNICSAFLVIDCPYSMIRKSYNIDKVNVNNNLTIKSLDIKDKINISAIIKLNLNLDNYSSKEFFNENISYKLNKHNIIGYAQPLEFYIDNHYSVFNEVANVVTIRRSLSQKKSLYHSLDAQMIIIYVNDSTTYDKVNELNLGSNFNRTLYMMIVLPSLCDALMNLKDPKYEDLRWCRLLQNKVYKKRKTLNFTYAQALNFAQELLNNPFVDAVEELYKRGVDNE